MIPAEDANAFEFLGGVGANVLGFEICSSHRVLKVVPWSRPERARATGGGFDSDSSSKM